MIRNLIKAQGAFRSRNSFFPVTTVEARPCFCAGLEGSWAGCGALPSLGRLLSARGSGLAQPSASKAGTPPINIQTALDFGARSHKGGGGEG